MGVLALVASALWGYAEATTFYVIPDVLLGWIAVHRPRLAVAAAFAATAGAVVGGALVYRRAPEYRARSTGIPGISDAMVSDAAERFARERWRAVIRAPVDGIPYKIYAAQAALAGRPLLELALVTPFARAWRFLVTVAGAYLIGEALRPVKRRTGLALLVYLAVWGLIYASYYRTIARRYGAPS